MTEEARLLRIEGSVMELSKSVDRLEKVVIFGDGERPSLVTSLDRLSTQIETAVRTVKAMWKPLLVIALLLLSNEFFGPAIRKELGLPTSENHPPVLHQQSELQMGSNFYNFTHFERSTK